MRYEGLIILIRSFFNSKLCFRSTSGHQLPSWLSISLDAALGCKTNVFQIQKNPTGKKGASQAVHIITIHPQAAPLVCRHILETLISLAKAFPHFLRPDLSREESRLSISSQSSNREEGSTSKKDPEFWDILLRLDTSNSTKKGKSVIKSHGTYFTL